MAREQIKQSMTIEDAIEVFRNTNAYGTMDIAKSVILDYFAERSDERVYIVETVKEEKQEKTYG